MCLPAKTARYTKAGLLLVATLSMMAPGVQAQTSDACQSLSDFDCCGDILLDFLNPGLKQKGDGHVYAHGQLFAQFQAIGAGAADIATFGFSFSPVPAQAGEGEVCAQEPWIPSGPYIINYRADTDPSDGFFINLQTTLVPDGEYMASVHAFDDSDNEIARAWTLAYVDNCDGEPPARCDDDAYPTEEHIAQDQTEPWPIMLPGDGELDPSKNNAEGSATLTLEFAEPLSELRVYKNGVLFHEKGGEEIMQSFDGRNWDDDLLPGYGPYNTGSTVAPECSQQPPQECNPLGEAWQLLDEPISDDDVIRVEAVDLAGNVAKKEIHIGSGGGGAVTIDVPRLQVTVDEQSKATEPGQAAVFRFSMRNEGGAQAHPFSSYDDPIDPATSAAAPGTWEISWLPHEPVDPGAETQQELSILPRSDVPPGDYQVNATISWQEGNEQNDRSWELQVSVGGGADPTGNQTTQGEDVDETEESPSVSVALLVFLVLACMGRRRP